MRRAVTNRLAILSVAVLVAALAVPEMALAAPTLRARPAFTHARWLDPTCAIVQIENDAVARRARVVTQAGERPNNASPLTFLDVDLAPGARKRVVLPLPLGTSGPVIVSFEQDGQVIAEAPIRVIVSSLSYPMVASIGAAPPPLIAQARENPELVVSEVSAEDLPATAALWPELAMIAWDEPRSTDLTPGQAAALKEHVITGGRLVVGVSPEEPDALATLGLADMLPARLARAGGLELAIVERAAGATDLGVEGALARRHGAGVVVLVPRPLSATAVASQASLMALPSWTLQDADRRSRAANQRYWQRLQAAEYVPWQDRRSELAPAPPVLGAAVILLLFFAAAVPLDGWLTRRSLKRGRRSRLGALRYPAIVAIATAAAFVTGGRAAGSDAHGWRLDIIEISPDGSATGRTHVAVAPGRTGLVRTTIASGTLDAALLPSRQFRDQHANSVSHVADARGTAALTAVETVLLPWEPLFVRASWTPDRVPAIARSEDACDPVIPACVAARAGACGDQPARDLRMPPEPAEDVLPGARWAEHAIARSLLNAHPGDLTIVLRGALGPDIAIDGASVDPAEMWTVVRFTLREPEPGDGEPPEETLP